MQEGAEEAVEIFVEIVFGVDDLFEPHAA